MPLETMTAANSARAAKHFTDWETNVEQVAATVNTLVNQCNRAASLYALVKAEVDAQTDLEYGVDAAAKMAALIAAQKANLKASLEVIAAGSGQSLQDLLDEIAAS